MFKIIGIILVGIVLGIIFRSRIASKSVSKIMMIIIYLLLLLLGIAVGANENIMNNLHTIGLKALIIAVSGVLGSAIAASIIYKKMYNKK